MPTYEYNCQNCGHDHETFQLMSADPLTICPECNTPSLKRKIGVGAGIIFKGGGFYETDFKDKKGSSSDSSSSSPKDASTKKESTEKPSPKPEA